MTHSVSIVGVGALGSHLVPLIRNLDIKITVIDFDRVEMKNTQSQLHTRTSVGKGKAQSLQKLMQLLFGLKIQGIPHRLTSDNVEALLGEADLIIDCLDNGASRRLIQRFVRHAGTPCIHGALAADGAFGLVQWDEQFEVDDEDVAGAATCEAGEYLPFISIVASLLSYSVQRHILKGTRVSYQISPSGVVTL